MDVSVGTRSLHNFKDILQERHGSSDFLFMSRKWEPLVANKHIYKTNPTKIKQDVFNSHRVQHVIEEISEEDNILKEILYKEVHNILDEIGYSRQLAIIRWLGIFLIKILKKTCTGLFVNESSVTRIKSIMGMNPVIFAPSHRSYADFILMSYICYSFDIDIPAIAAGMDFHSMWLMGRILRDCCAFFMRRSFGNDKLYWTTFREYVNKLVTDGDTAIEFFIEGTRSRTSKSLPPKFGFLSMALEPFFMGRVPDVTIVPINITYDRTLEEVLFAYELLGVPKPKESTSGLIKALNMLDEKYGRVYMDFAEPISVKQFCGARDSRWQHSLHLDPLNDLNENETAICVDLAHHVIQEQRRHAVLTPFNLIAVVLSNTMFHQRIQLPVSVMAKEISWLKSVMETLGALVDFHGATDVEMIVKEALSVHKFLVVSSSDILQLANVHSHFHESNPAALAGHWLSNETMEVATPVIMLQHYVNPCLHYLINPAIITTVIIQSMDSTRKLGKDELFRKYHFLRMLLSNEFVLYDAWEDKEFEDSLHQLDHLNIVKVISSSSLALGSHYRLQVLLCNMLQPFLAGYLVLCEVICQEASSPCSERYILKAAQKQVEELLLSENEIHPYSLSLDMHASALQSLVSLQAVDRLNISGAVKYQSGTKLKEVTRELGNLVVHASDRFNTNGIHEEEFLSYRLRAKL